MAGIALARHLKPLTAALLCSPLGSERACAALCDMQCAPLWRRAQSPSLPGRRGLCVPGLVSDADEISPAGLPISSKGIYARQGPVASKAVRAWLPTLRLDRTGRRPCCSAPPDRGLPLIRPRVSPYHGITVHRCCAPACLPECTVCRTVRTPLLDRSSSTLYSANAAAATVQVQLAPPLSLSPQGR